MDIKKNQLFTLVLPSIFYCISFNNYFFFSFHSFNFFFLSCKIPARTSFRKCFVFSFLEIWELISFLSFPTYVVQFIRLSSEVIFMIAKLLFKELKDKTYSDRKTVQSARILERNVRFKLIVNSFDLCNTNYLMQIINNLIFFYY